MAIIFNISIASWLRTSCLNLLNLIMHPYCQCITVFVHYGHGELGELEEDMRRAFHGHFKKDLKVKDEIGVMLASSFDEKKSE